MNIAVLFYGRLYNYDKHYNNIMNFLNKDNNNLYIFLSSDNEPDDKLKGFIELYKPISYINESITHKYGFSHHRDKYPANIDNTSRHFINKKRVFKLYNDYIKTKNIKIDLIVSLRIDLLFKEETKNIDNYIDMNIYKYSFLNILVPKKYNYEGLNDQIAFGNHNIMEKYMNIIDNIDHLLDKYEDCCFHPETLTLYNMILYNIDVTYIDIDYILDK